MHEMSGVGSEDALIWLETRASEKIGLVALGCEYAQGRDAGGPSVVLPILIGP